MACAQFIPFQMKKVLGISLQKCQLNFSSGRAALVLAFATASLLQPMQALRLHG
jgi:hypothetical protein